MKLNIFIKETDFVSRLMDVMVCSKVMDCSLPLLFQGFQLLVPWPKEETRILSPIRPFQLKVFIFEFFFYLIHDFMFLKKNYEIGLDLFTHFNNFRSFGSNSFAKILYTQEKRQKLSSNYWIIYPQSNCVPRGWRRGLDCWFQSVFI